MTRPQRGGCWVANLALVSACLAMVGACPWSARAQGAADATGSAASGANTALSDAEQEAGPEPRSDEAADTPTEGDEDSYMPVPLSASQQMFFDARTTGFTRDGKQQVFRGDVVAIGSGAIITADEILMDQGSQRLVASGHVILLTESQVFTGSSVEFNLDSGDFKMVEARMVSNDAAEARSISRKILGFTAEEMEFEQKRTVRLGQIEAAKSGLRDQFRRERKSGENPSDQLVDQYALLLERESLTKGQENPIFAGMVASRRKVYQSRRQYWERGRRQARASGMAMRTTAYFRLEGKSLVRQNDNDYSAEDAVWSPCYCEEDETPAWGFRARSVKAQVGGYADMQHPVLEIKGIPVLYLPYLKLPIKSERQSGFLMPVFVQESRSGSIYSQPVYFVLGENKDATITTDLSENRGTKAGVEYRHKLRRFSGWTLKLESIRDRIWLNDRAVRADIVAAQTQSCDELPIDEQSACVEANQRLSDRLGVPNNTWRGSQTWRGMSFLANRWSLVSHGQLYSDHRYVEELLLPDAFKDTFEIGHRATYFSTAKAQVHADYSDFYAGVSTKYADNVTMDHRFGGYQLPAVFGLQSRLFSLLPDSWGTAVYGSARADHFQIKRVAESPEVAGLEANVRDLDLGNGAWQRARLDLTSPVVTEGVVKVDVFANGEARRVEHAALSQPESRLLSSQLGLTLNLPIDGEMPLPRLFQTKAESADMEEQRHLHHIMNWALTFSVRPSVQRRGPYAQLLTTDVDQDGILEESGPFTYFVSDRAEVVSGDRLEDAVSDEQIMRPHQRLTLSTGHRWQSFSRGWLIQPSVPRPSTESAKLQERETLLERARRELLYSLDQPVTSLDDLVTDTSKGPVWHVNRFALQSYDPQEHVNLSAAISYDFLLADERTKQEAAGIPEGMRVKPWSDPTVKMGITAAGFYLNGVGSYDLYATRWTSNDFGLSLPTFLQTTVGLSYEIDNRAVAQVDGSSIYRRTIERAIRIGTSIIPNFRLDLDLRDRLQEAGDPTYQSRFNVRYMSPSRCWQLDFVRTKAFGLDERQARYLLQLTVLFMGQARALPDMHRPFIRRIPGDREEI